MGGGDQFGLFDLKYDLDGMIWSKSWHIKQNNWNLKRA